MQLPSPVYRGVPGASVRIDERDRLEVRLPACMVPARRYVRVGRVWFQNARGVVRIELHHEEPFTVARPGRHAWQQAHQDEGGVRITRLQHRGVAADAIHRVRRLAAHGARALVRVTDYGFEVQLVADDRGMGAPYCGMQPGWWVGHPAHDASDRRDEPGQLFRPVANTIDVHNSVMDAVPYWPAVDPGYARRAIRSWMAEGLVLGGDRRGRVRDELVALRGPYASMGRMTDDEVVLVYRNIFNAKEHDMKSIDTTTAQDLPVGLIAGETLVSVQFGEGPKDYAYYSGGLAFEPGDYAVVASPYGDGPVDEDCGGHLTVVRVAGVGPTVQGVAKAAKWIVGKVDVTEYRERRKRVEELRLLDAQIRQAERQARALLELQKLKELSPELAGLIAKREALTK